MTEVISTAARSVSVQSNASQNRVLNYALIAVALMGALAIMLGIMIF
jgi:hypothetical protein